MPGELEIDSKRKYRSSQSDYNGPTSRRPQTLPTGPLSDYGGSTRSLKIVRKPPGGVKNGYLSSSDESYQDPRPPRSMSMPRTSNKNSVMKKTVRRVISRRDSSPQGHDSQRIVVQETKTPERISVFMKDEVDTSSKSKTLPLRDFNQSHSKSRDRAPGKVHTIQTLTRETSQGPGEAALSSHTLERTQSNQNSLQPLHVSTMMRKEVVTNQQAAPLPVTSGHTTLTFSGHKKPHKEETYVNKVFQQSDQPVVSKESFKSGVIQAEDEPRPVACEAIIPQQASVQYEPPTPPHTDMHKTRINFVTSAVPATKHRSKIIMQKPPPPIIPLDEPDLSKPPPPIKPRSMKNAETQVKVDEQTEEIEVYQRKQVQEQKVDKTDTPVARELRQLSGNQQVEEIDETTIREFYSDMSPERQDTFSELTQTALRTSEQATGNFFNGGDNRSLITEAWHTNRPKTEQEIVDEITSKTTSEVVKRSILDGVDYKYVPTHSKELEEIQRKRKEFEAEMERQKKIRDIKAGIRQNIHVDHNEEDLVGDYSMSVTDDGQIDLDTIEEHVDLGISASGVAAIAVKVTAERILPVDVDQQLWRRSSVTVTRTIEIDLMRCEETRRLYDKILKASRSLLNQRKYDTHKTALQLRAEESAKLGVPPQQRSPHELDATDTYKIFSELMNVTGEAGNEELGILSDQSAKAFLSGDYSKHSREKHQSQSSASVSQPTSQHHERVSSTVTSHSVPKHNAKGDQIGIQVLNSIDPEEVRRSRSSEYYKQKMRSASPPPEFGTPMFDGQRLAEKFDKESSRRTHDHSPGRSLSPVGQLTTHQRRYYEQSGATSPRGRQTTTRREVRTVSPPTYRDRVENEYREVHSGYAGEKSLGQSPAQDMQANKSGQEVLFRERVSGVKQRANEMRRSSELDSSRESLTYQPSQMVTEHTEVIESNSNSNNNSYHDMPTQKASRRRVYSRDSLLYGGDTVDHGHTVKQDERPLRQDNHSKDNYESGYYSDVSKHAATTDINRMLNDAERYFKKTASERELSKSEKGYYSPRYNKHSVEYSSHDRLDQPFENHGPRERSPQRTSHRDESQSYQKGVSRNGQYEDEFGDDYAETSTARRTHRVDSRSEQRSSGDNPTEISIQQHSQKGVSRSGQYGEELDDQYVDGEGYERSHRVQTRYEQPPEHSSSRNHQAPQTGHSGEFNERHIYRKRVSHQGQHDDSYDDSARYLPESEEITFEEPTERVQRRDGGTAVGGRDADRQYVYHEGRSSSPDQYQNSTYETRTERRAAPPNDNTSATNYMSVRTRRSQLSDMHDPSEEELLEDRRRAMLEGSSYNPKPSRSRQVVTTRRSTNRRW
ncbi:uncharacterized protein [Watersipora subatra]|uniref:uncharacterized protein n=1 Tax=Watersipora subatra TaxID=2589382 RepID=UPI00355B23B4